MRLLQTLVSAITAQRQYFSQGREDIARENLITMQIAGSIGSAVCGIFFVIAPIIIPSWRVTLEYILIVPLLLLTFFFAYFQLRSKKKLNPRVVEIACALFYCLLLSAFIALSVFPYPNTPQIFISLCFMFMPVLMIQRPWVQLCIMAGAEIVFLALASRYKTTFSLENDIFNTVAALFFALIIMCLTNRLRWRNYKSLQTLERLSQTDALTGLLNKKAFEEACAAYLESPEACEGNTFLMLDLDDFKQVNDTHGHLFGDALLTATGDILLQSFRKTDLVGRVGGDEFALLLRGVCDDALLEKKCQELRGRFAAIVIDGVTLRPTCSMGAVISQANGTEYPQLFRLADAALYQSKREKKGSAVIVKGGSSDV